MSTQYHKEIVSNGELTLQVNFSGIKNGVTNTTDLKMSFYVYDKFGTPKFSEVLEFKQIKSLFDHLNQISIIRDPSSSVSGKFIEASQEVSELFNKLVTIDPGILTIILNKFKGDEKLEALLTALSEIEIDDLFTLQKRQAWQTEIDNLEKLLELEEAGNIVNEIKTIESLKPYIAGQPEKIFQNWIEKNHLWIFGVEYIKKYDARKIALFSEGDLLMESMDGFLDLIELKRPKLHLFSYDPNHKSYYPSPELSAVIGQCLFYLEKMDDFKLNIEKEYKVKMLRPRIKIIAGRTNSFIESQYNSLRMLNCNLNSIQIISYDYLLSCGKKAIANLNGQ